MNIIDKKRGICPEGQVSFYLYNIYKIHKDMKIYKNLLYNTNKNDSITIIKKK